MMFSAYFTRAVLRALLAGGVWFGGSVAYAFDSYKRYGVAALTVEEPSRPDVSLKMLYGVTGYEIVRYIAFEGRGGFGVAGDDENDLENLLGLYLRLGGKVGNPVSLYGFVGYSSIRSDSYDSDSSYGFGVDFNVTKRSGFSLEYANYYDAEDGTDERSISGLSISFLRTH